MRKVDIFSAVGLLVFVALMVFVIIPGEASGGVWHGLSPYFYPAVMLAGIAFSSVGLLVQAVRRPDEYKNQTATPVTREELGFFLLISAIVFVSVLVMHWLGNWVGGAVLIAGTMIFMGCLNPLRIVAVTVPTLIVTYALVTWMLKIPLP